MKRSMCFMMLAMLAVGALYIGPVYPEKGTGLADVKRAATTDRLKTEALQQYDVDKNGVLDPAEKEAMRKDREARLQELKAKLAKRKTEALQQYDVDKNGVLDPAEKEAMRKDREARLQELKAKLFTLREAIKVRTRPQTFEGKALERFDANQNGVLDPDEREAMRRAHEAWVRQLKARVLEKFDTNKNGVLDPDEKEAMRGLLQRLQNQSGK